MRHTPEQIKEAIKNVALLDDELLVHYLKCISCIESKREKDNYSQLVKAIEKERKVRGKEVILSNEPPKEKDTTTADAYDDE